MNLDDVHSAEWMHLRDWFADRTDRESDTEFGPCEDEEPPRLDHDPRDDW